MYFTGITIALMTFLAIGIWHPIVIKTEYYWGTRPWVVYLLVGIACCATALFVENVYVSSFLGVESQQEKYNLIKIASNMVYSMRSCFPM